VIAVGDRGSSNSELEESDLKEARYGLLQRDLVEGESSASVLKVLGADRSCDDVLLSAIIALSGFDGLSNKKFFRVTSRIV
jgi:hypothetical protein